jgi:hypothetical protein
VNEEENATLLVDEVENGAFLIIKNKRDVPD